MCITQSPPLGGATVHLEEELRTKNTPGVCYFLLLFTELIL